MTPDDATLIAAGAKRIERIGDATLILGDCREIMRALPPASVDMVWTDPPYGHGNHDGDFNSRLNLHRGLEDQPIANDTPDAMRAVVDAMLAGAVQVLKDSNSVCCCCCGGGPRPTFAWVADRMDRGGLTFFHSVIWDKKNPGLGWRYRRQHEMVMVAHKACGRLKWPNDAAAVPNIIAMMPPRERAHPNEKPVALPMWFIENHTLPGDVVLDPFTGGGTTGVAALTSSRRFIGIEIEPRYFNVACRRIAEAEQQPALFQPEPKPVQMDIGYPVDSIE
jgi:DNA modification methylase